MFKFSDCPLQPNSRVWAYIRDSGGDGQDLASQRAYLTAYCAHYRLILVRLFEDSAVSGGSTAGRDEFGRLIDLARRGTVPDVEAILYWDTKRFARNQNDSIFYKADLRRRGYRLVSLSDDIPDGPFGTVIEAFLEWKAQQDRLDLSKDVRRGMAYLVGLKGPDGRYLGIFPGARPTFFAGEPYDTGLTRNDGSPRIVQRLIPDRLTWELGRRAWEMRANKASYRQIENELGLFPGNIDPGSTYRHIFRNEIYIGRMHYGGQVYEDFVPHLATPDQWAAVQEINESFASRRAHPKTGRGQYLLSGLCRCLYCGAAMHAGTERRRERRTVWPFYVCSYKKAGCVAKKMSGRKLDKAITEAVCSRILTVDFIERLVDEVNAILADTDQTQLKIEQAATRLAEIERMIDNLMYQAELSPSLTVAKRLTEREAERSAVQHELAVLESRVESGAIKVDQALVVRLLAERTDTLRGGRLEARKAVLREAVERVEVGREAVKLYYTFSLDAVGLPKAGKAAHSKLTTSDFILIGI